MNTNKLFRLISVAFILIGFTATQVQVGYAQATSSTVSFTMLGQTDVVLRGPLDVQSFSFNIPADWQLIEGSQLHLDYSISGGNTTANASLASAPGYITVYLNSKPIGTIVASQNGEGSVDFTIPVLDWATTDPTSPTKSLEFYLETGYECRPTTYQANNETAAGQSILIRSTSYFTLPYNIAPITTDLRSLPYPLYQNTFIPDQAVLAVPDNPSQAELQAAFTASAALGRLTNGKLNLGFTTISKLNPAQLADSHVIYVGKASSFAQLATYSWPMKIQGQGFSGGQIAADDGVVEEIASPQDPNRVWLLVSGQSDAAVIKASQALASGQIRVGSQSNLAVITSTQETAQSPSSVIDHSFSDLGYQTQAVYGPGSRYLTYHFQIPAGKIAADGAYLSLVFSNSALLDYDQSGISLTLNNALVGGFRFSDQSAQTSTWTINLPASSFQQGDNYLIIEASMEPISFCTPDDQMWFSSNQQSVLHLPLTDVPAARSATNLSDYPAPFNPDFSHMAFVVAHNDQAGWSAASAIAYDLGLRTGGALIDPVVAYADNVPDSIRQQRDLLVVGQPSSLPIMKDLSASMPAPFPAGSDIATEPGSQFNFLIIPNNTPVGYLEIFTSPWNQQRSVVTVSGNSTDGLNWGATAFITPDLRAQLTGNVAVLYTNNQVIAAQVASASSASSAATPVVVATQTTSANSTTQNGPNLLLISVVAVLVLVILGFLVWILGRRRSQ